MPADKKPTTVAEMVEQLRLTPRLEKLARLHEVSDDVARRELGLTSGGGFKKLTDPRDYSGITFPGYDLSGKSRGTYQVRRHTADIDKGKEVNKWMSAQGSANRYINTTPCKLRASDVVIRVESPKSTWAVAASAERVGRKNVKVIDTNGLNGWVVTEKDEKGNKINSFPNPDLLALAEHEMIDIPDSNALRSDLAPKVEMFQAHMLETVHVTSLRTVRLPLEPGVNGPDDYLRKYGDEKFWTLVDAARASWRETAPPLSDFANYKIKADMLVSHVIANKAITVLAAPSEGYKTLFAFHVARALLTGGRLFEHFDVEKQVPYVLYNIPDMSFEMTLQYARPLGLDTATQGFHVRTPKQGGILQPDNPIMKAAARDGAYFVFDTMTYFLSEDVNPQVLTAFVEKVRRLVELGSPGALLLAHPTKAGTRSAEIEVSEWVSGTYQKIGTVDTIFCLKKVPVSETVRDTYVVYVSREKSRPFLGVKLDPFTLGVHDYVHGEGSYLEKGRFPVMTAPGETRPLVELLPASKRRGGRPETPDKAEKLAWLRAHLADASSGARRLTMAKLTERLNGAFPGSGHAEKLIREWLKEIKSDKRLLSQVEGNTGHQARG